MKLGKLEANTMRTAVFGSLGSRSRRVLVGPSVGFDNAILSVGRGKRMITTTDPVSVIPGVGMSVSAWLSVHLIASDYTTSGRRPEFATFCFNLPGEMSREEAVAYLKSMGDECRRLGVSIVGGHTGSYVGAGFTVVGGGTMFGFCEPGQYIDPSMAKVGDTVIMTKGAAIEAAATLAWSFPDFTEEKVGRRLAAEARRLIRSCSTVTDALEASSAGVGHEGVTSMHDATEGGVLGALQEMAGASGRAFAVEHARLYASPEATAVCSAFGLNPLSTLSEGTLILTCRRDSSSEVLRRLRRNGVPAFEVGRVEKGRGLWLVKPDGHRERARESVDRYWQAYDRATKSGLK